MTSPDGFIPGSTNTGWGDVSEMADAFVNDQGGLLGMVANLAIQRINDFAHDMLDAMDGATGGVFNLDDLADRLYGTERGLQMNVPRLDNRIDTIILANMQAQLATYSSTDTWLKPTDAKFIKVDVLGGASGGGRSNINGNGGAYRGGLGGYSGGWASWEFDADDVPASVLCTIGPGGAGATSDGGAGSDGGLSSFGDLVAATGGSSVNQRFGAAVNPLHDHTFKIRGGNGSGVFGNGSLATAGGDGPYGPGGSAPEVLVFNGANGNPGKSVEAGQIGPGSGGGGANGRTPAGNGGIGGAGGWPAGPGGGGGHYESFGFAGNGGNGAGGAIFVTTRFY